MTQSASAFKEGLTSRTHAEDGACNTSKLNLKSRENSLIENMRKLDDQYQEEIKNIPPANPELKEVVFFSGLGYKSVKPEVIAPEKGVIRLQKQRFDTS